jgi:hypothetical protein
LHTRPEARATRRSSAAQDIPYEVLARGHWHHSPRPANCARRTRSPLAPRCNHAPLAPRCTRAPPQRPPRPEPPPPLLRFVAAGSVLKAAMSGGLPLPLAPSKGGGEAAGGLVEDEVLEVRGAGGRGVGGGGRGGALAQGRGPQRRLLCRAPPPPVLFTCQTPGWGCEAPRLAPRPSLTPCSAAVPP